MGFSRYELVSSQRRHSERSQRLLNFEPETVLAERGVFRFNSPRCRVHMAPPSILRTAVATCEYYRLRAFHLLRLYRS